LLNQRSIYDRRYDGEGYDSRSKVRVLTAEADALGSAADRALRSLPGARTLTLFDFGYGTGRVTNEFAVNPPRAFRESGRNLHVVAYDVSAVGLDKAALSLAKGHGFDGYGELGFVPSAARGYVAGSLRRMLDGTSVTITFVHGNENEDGDAVRRLVLDVTGGSPAALTTSWYSAISHIPGSARRASFFHMLAGLTDPRGELLIAPSVSGDLVELQEFWKKKRIAGEAGDYPIEVDGDVIYDTELSQENYYHVFGPDLWDLLQSCVQPGQQAWLEAIRLPDEEFESQAEEQDNYDRTRRFNQAVGRRRWTPEDYRKVHTAAAIRSGSPAAADH
jgi:hypothetical protein